VSRILRTEETSTKSATDTDEDSTADPNLSRAVPDPDPDPDPDHNSFFRHLLQTQAQLHFFWCSMKFHCGSTVISNYCFHPNSLFSELNIELEPA